MNERSSNLPPLVALVVEFSGEKVQMKCDTFALLSIAYTIAGNRLQAHATRLVWREWPCAS